MTVPVHRVSLAGHVGAWFTGKPTSAPRPPVGQAGNLSSRRPHDPTTLAQTRRQVCADMDLEPEQLHWMRQVHGNQVAWLDAPRPGVEVRGVDALVTDQPDVALVVQVADCVPLLLASAKVVAAVHAGRRGVESDVVGTALDQLGRDGTSPADVVAVIGPAIGGCCYEVPVELQQSVAAKIPVAATTTTWGTPSLDLPTAVETRLRELGVARIERFGGCTYCNAEGRWFSHRADPGAGRQIGVVVRRGDPA